jgi:hypothetical protein
MQTESRHAAGSRADQAAQPGSSAAAQQIADCSRLSALALLPHCHALFTRCCLLSALAILSFSFYWQYCHLENIGNIVIQKTLAILSFDFKCWNYAGCKMRRVNLLVILPYCHGK